MTELFNEIIMCSNCEKKMQKENVMKNGFTMRALICSTCNKRILHPADVSEYEKFNSLRQKPFRVKLRLVGNSYAVSIPKEIVDFVHEQERVHNDMVNLFFEEARKLSLFFDDEISRKGRKVVID